MQTLLEGPRVEIVPLRAACWVTAHVVNGRVVKVEAEVSEIEFDHETVEGVTPKPSQAAIDAILAVQTFPDMTAEASMSGAGDDEWGRR